MKQAELEKVILTLIARAIELRLISDTDKVYILNRILRLFQQDSTTVNFYDRSGVWQKNIGDMSIPYCLHQLCIAAVERKLIEDLSDMQEIFAAEIMNCFLDKPSTINQQFHTICAQDPLAATDWFYHLSRASNYIQSERIEQNIAYTADSPYGCLDITINLAKPEKNPRDIIAARRQKSLSYPRCMLCVENEGYAGRISYPARAVHRMIRLELSGEPWYFQYSPYSYYNEHCIILGEKHQPMQINRRTFARLIEFTDRFPHYFIGSNADLPLVGGSILSHDHYQGGRYEFAMNRAELDYEFDLPGYSDIKCGLVRWPMSTIRLMSENKAALIRLSDLILENWRHYSDPAVELLAASDGEQHNTVTPIVFRRGPEFVIDLVLRNNRTSSEHPLGIFHPHADVQHIKKENIGLIEVMGLAVLPPRLAGELEAVELYLQGKKREVAALHQKWADELLAIYGKTVDAAAAREIVRTAVAGKFTQVLTDAGVFKRDATGTAAFKKFISQLRKVLA